MKFKSSSILAILSIFLLISCTEEIENRGYVTKFSDFSKLKVDSTNKLEVLQLLGSPTTTSNIDGEKWMYLGVEETKETFYEPEVRSYEAYVLSFNDSGILSKIDKKDNNKLNEFEVSEDYTSTGGNEVTFMQQLLGNLGKFNPQGGSKRR